MLTDKIFGKDGESVDNKLKMLFESQIKDIYWAEKELTKAIPKMVKNASSRDLTNALQKHLGETQNHVTRLEQVFTILGKEPETQKCKAMSGIISEADDLMSDSDEGPMRDAAIILAGQKVEHYEIATYGALRAYAETLGMDKAAKLLEETLNEEKAADQKLTEVAKSAINTRAAQQGGSH